MNELYRGYRLADTPGGAVAVMYGSEVVEVVADSEKAMATVDGWMEAR